VHEDSCWRPSRNPHSFLFDILEDVRRQSRAGRIADVNCAAEDPLEFDRHP
jgi:hypothetical protein